MRCHLAYCLFHHTAGMQSRRKRQTAGKSRACEAGSRGKSRACEAGSHEKSRACEAGSHEKAEHAKQEAVEKAEYAKQEAVEKQSMRSRQPWQNMKNDGENMESGTKENRQFRILSALGIIFVVAGHLGCGAFELGGLFPYYSFHVFVFLFVSGYFYREEAEQRIGSYILRKVRTLLLPYFLWNLFYGIVAQLLHLTGFGIGGDLSLWTLFAAPFVDGHQFMYNFPAWFVPALFLVEVINVLMRKILGMLHLKNEWLIFAGCMLFGILTVKLAIGGHVWGWHKIPGRLLFMLPGFQMGRIYKEKLEKHDTLPDGIYLLIVVGMQILISVFGNGLAFSTVWVSSFASGAVIPYLTVITGIAFWLRIAGILEKIPETSKHLVCIGQNTFQIMMHHAMVFMLIKGFFYLCYCLTPFCKEFNSELFLYDINYVYLVGGTEAGKWIYLFLGIALPLLFGKWTGLFRKFLYGIWQKLSMRVAGDGAKG